MEKSVIVVGAGIAGIQAALDLAEMGADVHLIEQTPSIGGRMSQLDKTFPTNDCSLCILSPKMAECARHPGITLHMNSNIQSIEGKPGNFRIRYKRKATYIDPNKCVACGVCEDKCPTKVEDEFDMGLRDRKAIYRYFVQSIPANFVIDPDHCLKVTKGVCGLCTKVCSADAINFDDKDSEEVLETGAVILATGIDPYNPKDYAQYGYGKFPNVVTSLEFERMLSASGPLMGHLECPSNGEEPRSVAFIQCVGSRDREKDRDYCSSVCCMYAMKEAVIAREHVKGLDASIFFMDARAHGKDFDKYYDRAKDQFGVEFLRSRISKIEELPGGNLRIHYADQKGNRKTRDYSMVVLSVGLEQRKEMDELARRLNIKLDDTGFCKTCDFAPLDTTKEGIFVCGATSGPKDIPESVMSASGAVARASKYLGLGRMEKLSQKEFPPEKDIIGNRPRVGVFVCHCGINIASVLDVRKCCSIMKKTPNVEFSDHIMYACSTDGLKTIGDKIKEHDLNRVVVAACSPRTHEPLFRETLREAGLNEYLFEMVNIRDQCSWAHMNQPELATKKAMDLVEMGIAKARNLVPLQKLSVDIDPKALVIGGGLAGMNAALSLAENRYNVYLLEKEEKLGGLMQKLQYLIDGNDPQKLLERMRELVHRNEKISVLTNSVIKNITGYIGNFETTIERGGQEVNLEHGVIIVATGANERKTDEYLRGKYNKVLTQLEYEKMLREKGLKGRNIENVVMIQCVGSREEGHNYCSRVCCSNAVKNALKSKEIREKTDVYVLYRDIRTYGLQESYFSKARDEGVLFSRYDLEKKPTIEPLNPDDPDSKLRVKTHDPILDEDISIDADIVVLSLGLAPLEQNEKLARMLKVPLNADKFFLEAHVKLRPVDFATDGIFLAGTAHNPKNTNETLTQSSAAAARAMTVLAKMQIESEGAICEVDQELCSSCEVCVNVCAYSAAYIDEETGKASIREALCKGCGACAASCRSGAIDLKGFTNQQIFNAIDALETAK
ncbi:MAG: FAD-dependent oxidoreductase [Candidatus Zixiibacteriota bacterium]